MGGAAVDPVEAGAGLGAELPHRSDKPGEATLDAVVAPELLIVDHVPGVRAPPGAGAAGAADAAHGLGSAVKPHVPMGGSDTEFGGGA